MSVKRAFSGSAHGFGTLALGVLALTALISPSVASAGGRDSGRPAGILIQKPLTTVGYVEVPRYMGVWYEIAHNPAGFQNGCTGTTATYSLNTDGSVKVLNRCYLDTLDGELNEIVGVATVADPNTNAKLSVSFPPGARMSTRETPMSTAERYLSGNYWIIGLEGNYEWALVGEPTRTYLWLLARTPQVSQATLDQMLSIATQKGYDTSRLMYTLQP